jgi:hypothetical protein
LSLNAREHLEHGQDFDSVSYLIVDTEEPSMEVGPGVELTKVHSSDPPLMEEPGSVTMTLPSLSVEMVEVRESVPTS